MTWKPPTETATPPSRYRTRLPDEVEAVCISFYQDFYPAVDWVAAHGGLLRFGQDPGGPVYGWLVPVAESDAAARRSSPVRVDAVEVHVFDWLVALPADDDEPARVVNAGRYFAAFYVDTTRADAFPSGGPRGL